MEARKQINEQSGTQQSEGNGKLRTHSKGEKKRYFVCQLAAKF